VVSIKLNSAIHINDTKIIPPNNFSFGIYLLKKKAQRSRL